jgi:hypothetical protein
MWSKLFHMYVFQNVFVYFIGMYSDTIPISASHCYSHYVPIYVCKGPFARYDFVLVARQTAKVVAFYFWSVVRPNKISKLNVVRPEFHRTTDQNPFSCKQAFRPIYTKHNPLAAWHHQTSFDKISNDPNFVIHQLPALRVSNALPFTKTKCHSSLDSALHKIARYDPESLATKTGLWPCCRRRQRWPGRPWRSWSRPRRSRPSRPESSKTSWHRKASSGRPMNWIGSATRNVSENVTKMTYVNVPKMTKMFIKWPNWENVFRRFLLL